MEPERVDIRSVFKSDNDTYSGEYMVLNARDLGLDMKGAIVVHHVPDPVNGGYRVIVMHAAGTLLGTLHIGESQPGYRSSADVVLSATDAIVQAWVDGVIR